ncbi:hypothetical protein SteCoe_10040 [Stentor coeruleus]|uniref:Tetratricopeptide repeat protein n=1 Tax=Stentor coeruleus TaxID=5963 RepID=A0A1R2CGA8_9CILI|nr:hypothetical protein SteCoe_10040 [Stentor coeruleus]
MEEPRKLGRPIGRKLQMVLLIPLVLGIIICTIFVIAIVFISQNKWLDKTKSYITEKELDFMQTFAEAVANQMQSILSNQWFYMNFVSQIYKKLIDSEIYPAENLEEYKLVNAVDTYNNINFPDFNTSVYIKGDNEIPSDDFKTVDAFMRVIIQSTNITQQIGIIVESSQLEYLYPLQNMSFIQGIFNNSGICGLDTTNYNPICTEGYTILKNITQLKHLLVYYQDGQLVMQNKFDYGTGVSRLNQSFLLDMIAKSNDYDIFAMEYLGLWTLFVSDKQPEEFSGDNKIIHNALYGTNNNAKTDFQNNVMPLLENFTNKTSDKLKASIDGTNMYFGFSNINMTISGNNEPSYLVGVSRSESDILASWDEFIVELLKITIIQACIFGIFFILTLVTAWRLAMIIVHRVTQPLESITGYLINNEPALHTIQKSFNSQINSILENLRRIQIIENFVDPSFLLNPVFDTRVKNLETAKDLFESIDNKRGTSIIYNLLGNAHFIKGKYRDAEECYRKALLFLEELLEEIESQEKEETNLTEEEKTQLRNKRDDFKESWADEKKFVKDSICERLQQICMALNVKYKGESENLSEMRNKWKELIKLQTRILQHYENSRNNYIRYLKLLIDMSEVYQTLQYFHTSYELLEIVSEELWKLDIEKKIEVDIDVNRLRKIGIDIFETDKNAHFHVKDITFEKDILMQRMLYRRGMIELDNDKYQKAALDFTLALESGNYYDPSIRKECVRELYNIMSKFGIISLAPDLKNLYDKYLCEKKSVLFCLAYELKNNSPINNQLVSFFNSAFENTDIKLGAITKNCKNKIMNLHERDFPGMDMENIIIQSKSFDDNENLIDLMHRGIDLLLGGSDVIQGRQSYIVVIYKKEDEQSGIGNLSTLQDVFPKGLKVIFVNCEDMYGLDFEIFIENNDGVMIDLKGKDFSSSLSQIKAAIDIEGSRY